tara:strand:+ start:82 stop:228 length:147 start_codon:yes stop_codon:yes gene_type:complete
MLELILEQLEIAKEAKLAGPCTQVALGKNKLPNTIKEAFTIFKQELWQ